MGFSGVIGLAMPLVRWAFPAVGVFVLLVLVTGGARLRNVVVHGRGLRRIARE